MSDLTLSPAELERLTGYSSKRPGLQLKELHRLGFYRARRGRGGRGDTIVERAHVEAVRSGRIAPVPIVVEQRKQRPERPFPWDKPTALYRHFDAAGSLLYVGVAVDPDKRTGDHRREQEWAKRSAKVVVEWFECRREALAAERAAIRAERPKFNTLHQQKEPC